jgi:hypothetical protein
MGIGLGLKYRHDLEGARGKAMRGWKELALIEAGKIENGQNESAKSDQALSLDSALKAEAA